MVGKKIHPYDFCKEVTDSLLYSGIQIDSEGIAKSASSGECSSDDFQSFIDDLISQNIYKLTSMRPLPTPECLLNSICNLKISDTAYRVSYFRELPLFSNNDLVSIESGDRDTLILSFSNGFCYRMKAETRSCFDTTRYSLTKISGHLANSYYAEDLIAKVKSIVQPLIEFEHEDKGMTDFMKSEFIKLLPFNSHFYFLNKSDIQTIELWEEYLTRHKDWKMSRDTVQRIINFLRDNIRRYQSDPTAPEGWDDLIGEAIVKLSLL